MGVILATLSELPSLTFLDFTSQNLYGALPNNVTFPRLEYLGLRHNQLQARLAVFLPLRSALQCKASAAGLTPACCSLFHTRPGTVRSDLRHHLRGEGDKEAATAVGLKYQHGCQLGVPPVS